jgi:hypothetical protein
MANLRASFSAAHTEQQRMCQDTGNASITTRYYFHGKAGKVNQFSRNPQFIGKNF